MSDKTIRCTDCASEFAEDELVGVSGCPTCGATGVPCAISEDVNVAINWHELRILGIWASWWAEAKFKDQSGHRTLRSIIARIEAQHPEKPALSFGGELKQIARSGLVGDIEVRNPDGTVDKIKGEKPS